MSYDPKELKSVERKIANAEKRAKELRQQRDDILRRTSYICGGCNQEFEIQHAVYLQTYWYESPHGCMGGDTWWQNDVGDMQCPHCEGVLSLRKNPEVAELRHLFKEIKKVYER